MAETGGGITQGGDRDAARGRDARRGGAAAEGDPGMGPRGDSLVRFAALALALAMGILSLSGCAPRAKGRTVVFWQFSPLTAIQPVLDRFHREHPDITVQVEQLTWQSGREKIVAAIAAGRPPDLAELGSTFLPGQIGR